MATEEQYAAGRRWATNYRRRHPRPRTERDAWDAFNEAEAADEREKDRRR